MRKSIPRAVRARVRAKTHGRCSYCGMETPLQIDHVFPVSSSGTDDEANLWGACRGCNNYKHDGSIDTLKAWLRRIGQSIWENNNGFRLAVESGVVTLHPDREPFFYFEKIGYRYDEKSMRIVLDLVKERP